MLVSEAGRAPAPATLNMICLGVSIGGGLPCLAGVAVSRTRARTAAKRVEPVTPSSRPG